MCITIALYVHTGIAGMWMIDLKGKIMKYPTTITVDESVPMSLDSVVYVDLEIIRIPFDGRGVEVWNGKKYVRRRSRIVQKEEGVFILEVVPKFSLFKWLKDKLSSLKKSL